MKSKWVVNPSSGKPDPMLTMSVLVVTVAAIRFLIEGVSVNINGVAVQFGHIDAMVYAALVSPVLGFHGYIKVKAPHRKIEEDLRVNHD